jgi:hypothetical protein
MNYDALEARAYAEGVARVLHSLISKLKDKGSLSWEEAQSVCWDVMEPLRAEAEAEEDAEDTDKFAASLRRTRRQHQMAAVQDVLGRAEAA